MGIVRIDPCTAATTSISASFRGKKLSIATGFYWRAKSQVFLITNWHVVTGRHPETGAHLSPQAGEPDELEVDLLVDGDLNKRFPQHLQLYNGGQPAWLEHRVWRSAVDVVAFPLGAMGAHCRPMNDIPYFPSARGIGDDVFVIGYPRGIGPDRHAIWKRASIASEPDVDVDRLPLRLIDTATTSGMSGSPVIQRCRGQGLQEDGTSVLGADGMRLLGVYSGRLNGPNENEVSLGRVWKEGLVAEIADLGVAGSREPRAKASQSFGLNFFSKTS